MASQHAAKVFLNKKKSVTFIHNTRTERRKGKKKQRVSKLFSLASLLLTHKGAASRLEEAPPHSFSLTISNYSLVHPSWPHEQTTKIFDLTKTKLKLFTIAHESTLSSSMIKQNHNMKLKISEEVIAPVLERRLRIRGEDSCMQ